MEGSRWRLTLQGLLACAHKGAPGRRLPKSEGMASAGRTARIRPFQKTLLPAGSRWTDSTLLTAALSPFKKHLFVESSPQELRPLKRRKRRTEFCNLNR